MKDIDAVFILDRAIAPFTRSFFVSGAENDMHVGPTGAKKIAVARKIPNLDIAYASPEKRLILTC